MKKLLFGILIVLGMAGWGEGAYVGSIAPEIGAYEFPTVGQSVQKNLNLLWVGK